MITPERITQSLPINFREGQVKQRLDRIQEFMDAWDHFDGMMSRGEIVTVQQHAVRAGDSLLTMQRMDPQTLKACASGTAVRIEQMLEALSKRLDVRSPQELQAKAGESTELDFIAVSRNRGVAGHLV